MLRRALSQGGAITTSDVPLRAPPGELASLRALLRGGPCVVRGWVDAPALRLDALALVDEALRAPAAPVREGRVVLDPRRGLRTERVPLAAHARAVTSGDACVYLAAAEGDLHESLRARLPAPALLRGAPWCVTKLWVGAAGTRSALHRDLAHNAHTVIEGCKRFWLAAPAHDRDVYPCAPWDAVPNGARVDPEHPDLRRFPRFARVPGVAVELRAGDTLLLPSGWWHHVRHVEASVAVNTFFAWGAHARVVAGANALKGALGLNR